ncbi:hypothetical protein ACSNOB_02395 [Micromonospora sp. URMC 106]|uniref:hypothetical protein n=1 Tax=Micromonospora sp. URMC 106 TaxID=3423408 RepID=UPI003F19FAF2
MLIGRLYVAPAGRYLGAVIDERDPVRYGTLTGNVHLVMIAGVVAALLVIALAGREMPLLAVTVATVGVLLVVQVLDRGFARAGPAPG